MPLDEKYFEKQMIGAGREEYGSEPFQTVGPQKANNSLLHTSIMTTN